MVIQQRGGPRGRHIASQRAGGFHGIQHRAAVDVLGKQTQLLPHPGDSDCVALLPQLAHALLLLPVSATCTALRRAGAGSCASPGRAHHRGCCCSSRVVASSPAACGRAGAAARCAAAASRRCIYHLGIAIRRSATGRRSGFMLFFAHRQRKERLEIFSQLEHAREESNARRQPARSRIRLLAAVGCRAARLVPWNELRRLLASLQQVMQPLRRSFLGRKLAGRVAREGREALADHLAARKEG